MSVKEVTLLRKSGNLKEAYKMAIDDLKEDRNNSWAQMSLFWVLRDMCQQLCNRNAIDKAKICLKEMFSLLPTMMDDSGAGEKERHLDRKSTRLNSSHWNKSRMPSSA